MKRSAEVASEGGATQSSPSHPLLLPPAEACHQLSEEGQSRVDADPELAPGHDCCAVCAGSRELLCSGCHSVWYCSAQHLTDDAPLHALVCPTLRCIHVAAAAADDEAQQQQVAGEAAAPSTRLDSTEASNAHVHRSGAEEAFQTPRGGQHGWSYVAPESFRSALYPVQPVQQAQQEGEGHEKEDELARKRARAAEPASGCEPAADSAAEEEAEAGPSAAVGVNALLGIAVQLAERTAVLTYAFTAAFALNASEAASAAVAAAAAAGRPLNLAVLGAAGDAELADPASWQVVADAAGNDVRILFVGPEVPDDLQGTEAQHGRVATRFVQSTYDELLAGCSGGGAELVPAAAPGPDVYLAFNPGLTCPDYDWNRTVGALTRAASAAHDDTSEGQQRRAQPCLVVATNTRMEALMESEVLLELGWRPEAPPECNPYTSLKPLQSGTLANDLYRKNAVWGCYTYGRGRRRQGRAAKVASALLRMVVAPIARLLKR
ncbi:hypothetical protein TSOC_007915 [Tetrabaena socialis]|uniref:Uncharacterized protein n=1 Tax=Tetrabaena socialis TaxID=47790 RepID=A0A2J7ZZW0_9CHLO|nr:hypothetical protein TSOC_007915 [Tetrabaena socialis]|eukprot:PNH05804.1 hypothetical protein TSOC_007915 [Tetrabaena socialis]